MTEKMKIIACMVIGVLISLIATGAIVKAKQMETQEHLSKEVFRFHVLANSDREEDQALKMQVKEEVISYMEKNLPKSTSAMETKSWAMQHLSDIEMLARDTITKAGFVNDVKVLVTRCYFPEKTYGDITFPSGEYDALRIEIGEAKGQNWWCVLYPNLCFIDAIHAVVPEEGKTQLKEVLEEDAYEMVTSKTRFRLKWFFFQ